MSPSFTTAKPARLFGDGRSPVLRLCGDERLVAMVRRGDASAFETLYSRYQSRLHGYCRHLLGSEQDAEDAVQDVFANAHRAMLADDRAIVVRPWLFRIARNRCLNQLRRQRAEGQDSMDVWLAEGGISTAERAEQRDDLRGVLVAVAELPEAQRSALLLRELDRLSYEEIARAMTTSVPGVRSLLGRARVNLADATQGSRLGCEEVRRELADAAEGMRLGGPARHHVRRCDDCRAFRGAVRSNRRAMAAICPAGPLAVLGGPLAARARAWFGGSPEPVGSPPGAGSTAANARGGGQLGRAGASRAVAALVVVGSVVLFTGGSSLSPSADPPAQKPALEDLAWPSFDEASPPAHPHPARPNRPAVRKRRTSGQLTGELEVPSATSASPAPEPLPAGSPSAPWVPHPPQSPGKGSPEAAPAQALSHALGGGGAGSPPAAPTELATSALPASSTAHEPEAPGPVQQPPPADLPASGAPAPGVAPPDPAPPGRASDDSGATEIQVTVAAP